MDETVHVRFEGEMVDKLLEIDEHLYAGYVTEEKGKKVMYVELLKALYGTLQAARLFWEKLQAKLVNDWGFTPNRYDSCVVNKEVNGKQLTVAWHVDDLKVSHQDEAALDEFIAMMEEEFGKETPLTIAGSHPRVSWNDLGFHREREGNCKNVRLHQKHVEGCAGIDGWPCNNPSSVAPV